MTRPLSDSWRAWLRLNFGRDCAVDDLFQRAAKQGFDHDEISRELGGFKPVESVVVTNEPAASSLGNTAGGEEPWLSLYHAPLTKVENRPRAWRLDTDLAQIYEIPGLLADEECDAMIKLINGSLRRSTTTRGPKDYRTSRTCGMRGGEAERIKKIDQRLADLIGCDVSYSEHIQGQRYDRGEYYKAHTDWFASGTPEFDTFTKGGGQRTWTVMIYLNDVTEGGETRFERVGKDFRPAKGLGIAWNNLAVDGSSNFATLHEAMPVIRGKKYIITKWFRERNGLNA